MDDPTVKQRARQYEIREQVKDLPDDVEKQAFRPWFAEEKKRNDVASISGRYCVNIHKEKRDSH